MRAASNVDRRCIRKAVDQTRTARQRRAQKSKKPVQIMGGVGTHTPYTANPPLAASYPLRVLNNAKLVERFRPDREERFTHGSEDTTERRGAEEAVGGHIPTALAHCGCRPENTLPGRRGAQKGMLRHMH